MTEAGQKILNLLQTNFWDWQFFLFVFFAVLVYSLFLIDQEKAFNYVRVSNILRRLTGKNEAQNYLIVALASVLTISLLVAARGIPVPQTHDEFGYLLLADTFLHGRLANPAPFSPQHFQYFHILVTPVYAAKFPPLQGLMLAVGKLLTGQPIAGVWLGFLFSNLAIYWLLRACFSLSWSLYGTFLWIGAPLNLLWCDSYWGAHVAVIGGALSVGAHLRLVKFENFNSIFIWGAGIFLLINSRLYEGAVLTAMLLALLIFEAWKKNKFADKRLRLSALLVSVVLLNSAFVAFYNFSVTTNPFELPYALHHAQYHRVPLFVFQQPTEPKMNVAPVIKRLDERWLNEFRENFRSPRAAAFESFARLMIYPFWLTRSPFLLILLLCGAFALWKDEEFLPARKLSFVFVLATGALLLTTFKGDRFIAAIAGIAFIFMTAGARTIFSKTGSGKYLILFLPLIVYGGFILGSYGLQTNKKNIEGSGALFVTRAQITEFLTEKGGKHLIFAETDDANPADARFYVYNEAEIKDSAIIWAHDLGKAENDALLENYPNRRVWHLKKQENRAVLIADGE